MSNLPQCPQCDSTFTYEDRDMFVCPECAHEWPQSGEVNEDEKIIKDSNWQCVKRWRHYYRHQRSQSKRVFCCGKSGH